MITAGQNLVRVSRYKVYPDPELRIYDLHRISLHNVANDSYQMNFRVPVGSKPPNLLNDLKFFFLTQRYILIDLIEKSVNGQPILMIRSIREPNASQEEILDLEKCNK